MAGLGRHAKTHELDSRGVALRCAGGEAHWQSGVVERHGAAWKMIFEKVVRERGALLEEICDTIVVVNEAKNCLRNRSGFSPRQWVFGSNSLRDDDYGTQDFDLASPDTKFGRLQ